VASKITDRYYRPCILISCEGDEGRGSGRSIEGFNLFKALSEQTYLLEKFGGHELAAGLTIKKENIQELRSKINEYADRVLTCEEMVPRIKVDFPVSKEDLTIQNIRDLDKLAPFGAGNPSPVFVCEDLKVNSLRTVGEGKHLKLGLDCQGTVFDAIGFNMGGLGDILNTGDQIEAACSLEINSWNSVDRVQLNLKDIVKDVESLTDNEYFYTLDQCLEAYGIEQLIEESESKTLDVLSKFTDITLDEIISLKGSFIILVNSLKAVSDIKEAFKNNRSSIKKQFEICYTCFNKPQVDETIILVNTDPSILDYSWFEKVVFYGNWICSGYLEKLLEKADKDKTFVNIKNDSLVFSTEDIIPERRDLVAVYQYIKANYGNEIQIENLFTLAENISESYKMNINYFKLKKGLEILEQVDILEKSMTGQYGMSIVLKNKKEKANLESSILYRKLQSLKYSHGKLEA
jgi:single-stranded-DNA-specific exonuclease